MDANELLSTMRFSLRRSSNFQHRIPCQKRGWVRVQRACFPAVRSHSLMRESSLPLTTHLPSGLNRTCVTPAVWPL
jgi:hypothetical protein